jgi:hypothetical protein
VSFRDDYILRLIQQVADFLARIAGHDRNQDFAAAVSEAERAWTEVLGVPRELVDVLVLVIGYPIVSLPLTKVLQAFAGELTTAIALTVLLLLVALLLVNRLRVSSGVVAASLGLLACTPLLLGLPLFVGNYFGGTSLQWVARLIVGLGVLAIFLGIRRQIQLGARGVIVPAADQQLGGLIAAGSESQAAVRLRALERFSDTLVNAVYLVAGYLAAVAPVTATLDGDLAWVKTAIYALFVLAVILVIVGLIRGIVPALRPAPKAAPAGA